jgi:hypothetical protein
MSDNDFPVKCTQDSKTWITRDGYYYSWECGLDGEKYCQPTISEDLFDDYWETCDDQDNIVTIEYFSYYKTYVEFYNEYKNAPTWALNLFEELKTLEGKKPDSDFSV